MTNLKYTTLNKISVNNDNNSTTNGNGALIIKDGADIKCNLNVENNTFLKNNCYINGNINIDGNSIVKGNSNINGNLTVTNNLVINDKSKFNKPIRITCPHKSKNIWTGALLINGGVGIKDNLHVKKDINCDSITIN